MFQCANDPKNIAAMAKDPAAQKLVGDYFRNARKHQYVYNFTWMGIPIIQHPADLVGLQELVMSIRPRMIVETGVAHGGSSVFFASMLELIGGDGMVMGIDIDIRAHNRERLDAHPMRHRIELIEGSSTDEAVVKAVHDRVAGKEPVLVVLDSMHSHEHVLAELKAYADLVTRGSYLVVMDSRVEDMEPELFEGKPWGKGNNPKTAVWEFLKTTDRFEIDTEMEQRLMITGAPDGFLRCVKE